MLTFGELAWAAYIYAIVTQGDKAYWKVEQSRKLIDALSEHQGAPTLRRSRK